MEAIFILFAAILSTTRAQCLPLTSSIQQVVPPCQSQMVTTTTIVDNSVSNALANAIQLLIVSNLIENTMNNPFAYPLQATVAPICDPFPIQASMYSPGVDIITPDCLPYPLSPYEPIISPCDIISPCEPVIEIIPNICQEVVPIQNFGYENPLISNFGYENFGYGNPSCGCDNNYRSLANILPNILPNLGCGCDNSLRGLSGLLPSILGLPNIGCGCNNGNPFGPLNAFDQGPLIPEVIFPPTVSTASCGYGVPNYPVGVAEPWNCDSFPNRYYGNNYYY